MKISDAIERLDELKSNAYTESEKVRWLSQLDSMIKRMMIDTHEGGEKCTFTGYDENTDMSTVLLAEEPFDDIYIYYLAAQIDLANMEYDRYNNSIMVFTDKYQDFADWYNRTHLPKGSQINFF